MRICAVSDTHGLLPEVDDIPDCDVLLLAGDICPCRGKSSATIPIQADWLNTTFRLWRSQLVNDRKIAVFAIPGNHDFIFQQYPGLISSEVCSSFFVDKTIVFGGLIFYFTPWQPTFGNWAYNADDSQLDPSPPIKKYFDNIPADTNILVTHGPPYGILDYTWMNPNQPLGSWSLRERLNELKELKLMVWGHIHTPGGMEIKLGDAILANVAYLDEEYRPWHKPLKVWEIFA
jgi:Icc-related predicted phosphoesterase